MRTKRVDEVLLQNYLLGNLSEEAQVQVEDRAFGDPNYLAAVEAAEADLIDSYVRGELSPPDRRHFERCFLLSPQRRNKVEFAKALAQVASESLPSRPLPQASRSLFDLFRGWSPALQFGAAMAALILIAGGLWLVRQNADLRAQIANLEAQQRAAEVPKPVPPSPAPEVQPRLPIPALVFLPGLTRAESRVQQLVIPPGAQLAQIELRLEPRDDFPRYRVQLRTRSGQDILSLENLRKQGSSVPFGVPAATLAAGDYELALKGLSGSQPTDLAYYYFRVERQ